VITTCIITCFNYQDFVKEAILSAVAQTVPFDEIIVIDDASSDQSPRIIKELIGDHANIFLIQHAQNLGQLAAFETGVMQSKGDLIFFLDADDVYAPNYLEASVSVYKHNNDCEFLFCRKIDVGRYLPPNLFEVKQTADTKVAVTDLGCSLVRTLEEKVWIGAPTSCLSIHRRLAKRLFPFPLPIHEDWRIRADDCIVFGASLAGCRKFRLESSLVGYRIHGNNAWVNRIDQPNAFFLRQVSIARLFKFFTERFYIDQDIVNFAELEFKTLPVPSFDDLCRYSRFIIRNRSKPRSRTRAIGVLVKWYFQSKGIIPLGTRSALQAKRRGEKSTPLSPQCRRQG
jgi:glycosyltransferase involved in cell wall biosynthesis